MDAVDGVVAFGFEGMNPIQVLQYIASGLLGVPSSQGGLKTAALGAALHYFIALAVAAIYYGASLRLSTLHVHSVKWGITYGAAVYLVMNYVISPRPFPRARFSLASFLNDVIGHAIFVGLAIARLTASFGCVPPCAMNSRSATDNNLSSLGLRQKVQNMTK